MHSPVLQWQPPKPKIIWISECASLQDWQRSNLSILAQQHLIKEDRNGFRRLKRQHLRYILIRPHDYLAAPFAVDATAAEKIKSRVSTEHLLRIRQPVAPLLRA